MMEFDASRQPHFTRKRVMPCVIEPSAAGRPHGEDWRRPLRRKIFWLVVLKLAALILLWALFFSPAQRRSAQGAAASGHFGLFGALLLRGREGPFRLPESKGDYS